MYDVIIIGCGPAGMTAAIYLARANKKVLILEKETIGGQISSSPLVSNYPGYTSISGSELSNNMYEQVCNLKVDVELETVKEIKNGDIKTVITFDNTYQSKAVIIATGVKHRLLGLEHEEDLIGNGIHFCVSCDGAFYKEKCVAVIGGGNSAIINAISLSDICKKVYVIQNLDTLTAEQALIEQINSKSNVEIICSSIVKKLVGEEFLEKIIIKTNGEEKEITLDGMFISIGLVPQNEIVKDLITLDKNNYIDSNDCTTNIAGIFVAGDARCKEFRQVTTATSDGTISALKVLQYLNN